MTKASNLSDSESAARRRILFQFARTNPSSGEFHKFVSDVRLLMPLPDDLVLEAINEFDLQQPEVNSKNNLDDTEMELEIEASGLQIFSEDGSPNLFALYAGDLSDHIISYASTSDLCTLDLVNNQFRELTIKPWEKITYERFGMKNGKDGWRMGTSLLRDPLFVNLEQTETHVNVSYGGSANVTANNSLVAIVTDDEEVDRFHRYHAPPGINLYDSTDLSYLGSRQEGQQGLLWKTTVAGPDGNRLFISIMPEHSLLFNRGDVHRRQHYPDDGNPDGIPLIATETHVVVVAGNTTKLYKIVSDSRLVELCQSELLQSEKECQSDDEFHKNTIGWGEDVSEFVVYHSIRNLEDDDFHFSEITIWKLDVEADTITRTQAIRPEFKLNETVLGEDFIAGSCELKKIHVWDRHNKHKTQSFLCDVEEDDELDLHDIIYPLHMVFHGHMLVTTSYVGDAICVWNMKTGQLLKRHYYDYDQMEIVVEMVNDTLNLNENDDETTSMAYLKPLNSYLCMNGSLDVWTFPTNQEQKDTAMMISKRAEDLRRIHEGIETSD